MDEGATWTIIWILVAVIAVLFIALAVVAYLYIKSNKKLFYKLNKNQVPDEDEVTEEIISMVTEGHEQGVLLASESEMIQNIFEFGEKEAKDIMTHRKNIVSICGDWSYYEVVEFINENSRSRYPVYIDDIDNIIGVLHIKDVLMYAHKPEVARTPIKDIKDFVGEVEFITETLNIDVLFKKMQSEKSHMCIVIDEYGQTSGLVAMEDILEEIVGNIEDEHDEESKSIVMQSDGTYLMEGIAAFEEVLEVLGIEEEDLEFETLNGWLISLLEKIPTDGETKTIFTHGYEFAILSVRNQRIEQVRVSKHSQKPVNE